MTEPSGLGIWGTTTPRHTQITSRTADLQGMSDKEIKADLYERALKVYDSQIAKLRDEDAVKEFQKVLMCRHPRQRYARLQRLFQHHGDR